VIQVFEAQSNITNMKTCELRAPLLVAAVLAFLGLQFLSAGTPPTIVNTQPAPLQETQGRVALCFFGLVKGVDDDLVRTIADGVVGPLVTAGFVIDSFLHTYHATTFSNAFNKETDASPFNQTRSLATLRTLLPNLLVAADDMATPDNLMPLARYLKAGDPWPFHPNESLRYFLRQQFSLLRVTEMWSGSRDLVHILVGGGRVELPPSIRARYDGVVYLRPDLYHLSKLNMEAFDSVIGASTAAFSRLRRASFDTSLALKHPWLEMGAAYAAGKRPLSVGTQSPAALSSLTPSFLADDDMTNSSIDPAHSPPSIGNSLLHIAIPTFEWGGLHDRFAFGSPEVMFFYGVRALALGYFIDVLQQPPHAEKYLRKYLCALGAAVHIVPQFSARKRVNGKLEDDGARLSRSKFFHKRVQLWAKWQQREAIDRYGRGPRRQCMFASMWAHVPFDIGDKRETAFKR
jgi:hypothetical protein